MKLPTKAAFAVATSLLAAGCSQTVRNTDSQLLGPVNNNANQQYDQTADSRVYDKRVTTNRSAQRDFRAARPEYDPRLNQQSDYGYEDDQQPSYNSQPTPGYIEERPTDYVPFRGWGYQKFAGGQMVEGCWLYVRTAFINSQSGREESYLKVVGQVPGANRITCSLTGGVLNQAVDSLPRQSPFRPMYQY